MHDRLEAESVARAHVSGHLAPQVTMIDQTDSLDERALDAIADHPRTGAAAKIGFILTSRPANDLRAMPEARQFAGITGPTQDH